MRTNGLLTSAIVRPVQQQAFVLKHVPFLTRRKLLARGIHIGSVPLMACAGPKSLSYAVNKALIQKRWRIAKRNAVCRFEVDGVSWLIEATAALPLESIPVAA